MASIAASNDNTCYCTNLLQLRVNTGYYQCAEDEPEKALQFFKMLYERAVEVQENDDVRDSRYSSACTILSLAGDDEYLL